MNSGVWLATSNEHDSVWWVVPGTHTEGIEHRVCFKRNKCVCLMILELGLEWPHLQMSHLSAW